MINVLRYWTFTDPLKSFLPILPKFLGVAILDHAWQPGLLAWRLSALFEGGLLRKKGSAKKRLDLLYKHKKKSEAGQTTVSLSVLS